MKQKIKTFIINNPQSISFLLWIYNQILGFNKMSIPSKNNVKIGAALMKKTKVVVKGINNHIIIKDFSRLINCNIYKWKQ